jgi:DNA-binding PadR family transcriptional regulator
MNFDTEYKLMLFREEQADLFDKNNKRYTATPIGKETAEMMLQLIDGMELEINEAEKTIFRLKNPKK